MNTAETKAKEVLDSLNIVRPPVPVAKIAARLGIMVLEDELGEVSGLLYRRSGDKNLILVNSDHHPHRKRFTIAHEIGHHILHTSDTIFIDMRDARSSLGEDHREIGANQFAAALLMPKEWITEEAKRVRQKQPTVSDEQLFQRLSAVFGVSPDATKYRLINLGLILAS